MRLVEKYLYSAEILRHSMRHQLAQKNNNELNRTYDSHTETKHTTFIGWTTNYKMKRSLRRHTKHRLKQRTDIDNVISTKNAVF